MTREDILINSFQTAIKKLLNTKNKEENFIDYKKIMQKKTSIENKINIVLKKQTSLMDSYMSKRINIGKYKYELNILTDELNNLNKDKELVELEIEKYNRVVRKLI